MYPLDCRLHLGIEETVKSRIQKKFKGSNWKCKHGYYVCFCANKYLKTILVDLCGNKDISFKLKKQSDKNFCLVISPWAPMVRPCRAKAWAGLRNFCSAHHELGQEKLNFPIDSFSSAQPDPSGALIHDTMTLKMISRRK